jgi:hypothetical protein
LRGTLCRRLLTIVQIVVHLFEDLDRAAGLELVVQIVEPTPIVCHEKLPFSRLRPECAH